MSKNISIALAENLLFTFDRAEYAFKPKDIILEKKTSSPDSVGKFTESEIKERISRLSQTLANKVNFYCIYFLEFLIGRAIMVPFSLSLKETWGYFWFETTLTFRSVLIHFQSNLTLFTFTNSGSLSYIYYYLFVNLAGYGFKITR